MEYFQHFYENVYKLKWVSGHINDIFLKENILIRGIKVGITGDCCRAKIKKQIHAKYVCGA